MKVLYTKTQKIIEFITALVIIFTILDIISSWSMIPDKIPTHFNFYGEADGWGSKNSIIIMPIIEVIIYISLTLISQFPAIWNTPVKVTEDNYIEVYQDTRSLLCYTKLSVLIIFSYTIIISARGIEISSWFIPITLLLTFGTIIYFVIKMVRCEIKRK
ncbi:MAG: DUF1648 domain-containing protein [Romboutsia sp.]